MVTNNTQEIPRADRKQCPINWRLITANPYPCAYRESSRYCTWPGKCIDLHMQEYAKATAQVKVKCADCGNEITVTAATIERYGSDGEFYCKTCTGERVALAGHIRGDA